MCITEYEAEVRTEWCANNIDIMNFCDGTKADCLAKGKEKCSGDEKCFGVMFHPGGWSRANKGIKLCTSRRMVKKDLADWLTYLKKRKCITDKKYSARSQ